MDTKKAVLIAKDVLKSLRTNRYVPNCGVFARISTRSEDSINNRPNELQDIIDNLNNGSRKCEVCALGACFLSHVALYDDFKCDRLLSTIPYERNTCTLREDIRYFEPDITTLINRLYTIFGLDLPLIENAFECGDGFYGVGTKMNVIAAMSYKHLGTSRERLIAIMKNIIRNKGRFIPPRKAYRQYAKEHPKC